MSGGGENGKIGRIPNGSTGTPTKSGEGDFFFQNQNISSLTSENEMISMQLTFFGARFSFKQL